MHNVILPHRFVYKYRPHKNAELNSLWVLILKRPLPLRLYQF